MDITLQDNMTEARPLYTMTLYDGTTIENLMMEGNIYTSEEPIDASIFEDNLQTVTVSDGETEQVYENMRLESINSAGGKTWFVLGEIPLVYTVTLADGTKLENLTLNGNNYISDEIVEDSVFVDNLETVTVSDGKTTQTYEDMILIANRVYDGQSWFVLAEKSPQQKAEEATQKEAARLQAIIAQLEADRDALTIALLEG